MKHLLIIFLYLLGTSTFAQPNISFDFITVGSDTFSFSCPFYIDTVEYRSAGLINYHFSNKGDSILVLGSAHGSCPHNVMSGSKYEPGESGYVSCKLITDRMGPIMSMGNGSVTSNDPEHATTIFRVKGFIRRPTNFENVDSRKVSEGTRNNEQTFIIKEPKEIIKENDNNSLILTTKLPLYHYAFNVIGQIIEVDYLPNLITAIFYPQRDSVSGKYSEIITNDLVMELANELELEINYSNFSRIFGSPTVKDSMLALIECSSSASYMFKVPFYLNQMKCEDTFEKTITYYFDKAGEMMGTPYSQQGRESHTLHFHASLDSYFDTKRSDQMTYTYMFRKKDSTDFNFYDSHALAGLRNNEMTVVAGPSLSDSLIDPYLIFDNHLEIYHTNGIDQKLLDSLEIKIDLPYSMYYANPGAGLGMLKIMVELNERGYYVANYWPPTIGLNDGQ